VSKPKKPQVMKPATAALKLDVYLPATPQEFQDGEISRDDLDELQRNPPQWLSDLRRDGPHPRNVVAARLRISNSGLARGGITDPLTSAEIAALAADPPAWLVRERETLAETRREERRLEEQRAEAARAAAEPPKPAKPAKVSKSGVRKSPTKRSTVSKRRP
jgi:hypothetical protein